MYNIFFQLFLFLATSPFFLLLKHKLAKDLEAAFEVPLILNESGVIFDSKK